MRQHEPVDVEEVPAADAVVGVVVDDLVALELALFDAVLRQPAVERLASSPSANWSPTMFSIRG